MQTNADEFFHEKNEPLNVAGFILFVIRVTYQFFSIRNTGNQNCNIRINIRLTY